MVVYIAAAVSIINVSESDEVKITKFNTEHPQKLGW